MILLLGATAGKTAKRETIETAPLVIPPFFRKAFFLLPYKKNLKKFKKNPEFSIGYPQKIFL